MLFLLLYKIRFALIARFTEPYKKRSNVVVKNLIFSVWFKIFLPIYFSFPCLEKVVNRFLQEKFIEFVVDCWAKIKFKVKFSKSATVWVRKEGRKYRRLVFRV